MTNPNLIQRGTQTVGLGVMIGRCYLDIEHEGYNVDWSHIPKRQPLQQLNSETPTEKWACEDKKHVLHCYFKSKVLHKEWLKFGPNPLHLIQANDLLTKFEWYWKKVGFLELREICIQVKKRENIKKIPPPRIETLNTENQGITQPNTRKEMLTQEDKIKVKLVKKIMTEKKTTLTSLRNQD